MKVFFLFVFFSISIPCYSLLPETTIQGQQPNLSIDTKGVIRVTYGNGEKIYCLTSTNNGISFSSAVLVAELPGMHLGNTRGPQIASSKNFSMISAMDKGGNIHSYRLNHSIGKWILVTEINDKKASAPEGLMAIAADKEDNFYATWLDIREGKTNNVYFSSINGKSVKWNANSLVYKSPDKHVCECCKPNIVVANRKIVIGFRNWLMGSRDIYYTVSNDKGKSFSAAQKSGTGTWKLNACPMDGGSLAVNSSGMVSAAWRRNGDVYYWSENQAEIKLDSGRDVSMAQNNKETYIAWQDKKIVSVMNLNTKKVTVLGSGVSPKVYTLDNGKAICFWEDDKQLRFKLI
ncbi:MAG: hypothetical protein Q8S11_09705 [Daejeonella sp.]|uniref:hypothetical protein n=1 Tax=Daejeonella sp. TaxID=2805397 RepID=UPI0027336E55|nr:hypothetical protein [Daejeonella sp.]MDP3468596.1 hypothetical protein [Daejeonella sp.]